MHLLSPGCDGAICALSWQPELQSLATGTRDARACMLLRGAELHSACAHGHSATVRASLAKAATRPSTQ